MAITTDEPRPFQLADEQWNVIAAHLPRHYRIRILNSTGNYRAFIEAVLWVVANNAPWTSIPSSFGSWRAIYVRFLRWVEDEHWISVERAIGLDSTMAMRLRERVERYRSNNRWRRKRGHAGTGVVANDEFEREIAMRCWPLGHQNCHE
ncbi:transposase [Pseudomonas sp. CGJS7]|uniref:transposase n=1 Tax=Pseudomonas sp. CGJS7 TaxID=3109348 RepID=UPI00300936AD